jgi:hypothetical protein
MKKLVSLRVLENYRILLRFNDGVEGEIDFSEKPRRGVFACWNDYDFFRRAYVSEFGALAWPGDLDLCPNALWLRVTGKAPEELNAGGTVEAPIHAHN